MGKEIILDTSTNIFTKPICCYHSKYNILYVVYNTNSYIYVLSMSDINGNRPVKKLIYKEFGNCPYITLFQNNVYLSFVSKDGIKVINLNQKKIIYNSQEDRTLSIGTNTYPVLYVDSFNLYCVFNDKNYKMCVYNHNISQLVRLDANLKGYIPTIVSDEQFFYMIYIEPITKQKVGILKLDLSFQLLLQTQLQTEIVKINIGGYLPPPIIDNGYLIISYPSSVTTFFGKFECLTLEMKWSICSLYQNEIFPSFVFIDNYYFLSFELSSPSSENDIVILKINQNGKIVDMLNVLGTTTKKIAAFALPQLYLVENDFVLFYLNQSLYETSEQTNLSLLCIDYFTTTNNSEKIFVSYQNGNDENEGICPKLPKKTISNALESIKNNPNIDVIHVEKGIYNENIHIQNYSYNHVTVVLNGSHLNGVFTIDNIQNITVTQMEFCVSIGVSDPKINILNSKNVVFDNVKIHGNSRCENGIFVSQSQDIQLLNLCISDCTKYALSIVSSVRINIKSAVIIRNGMGAMYLEGEIDELIYDEVKTPLVLYQTSECFECLQLNTFNNEPPKKNLLIEEDLLPKKDKRMMYQATEFKGFVKNSLEKYSVSSQNQLTNELRRERLQKKILVKNQITEDNSKLHKKSLLGIDLYKETSKDFLLKDSTTDVVRKQRIEKQKQIMALEDDDDIPSPFSFSFNDKSVPKTQTLSSHKPFLASPTNTITLENNTKEYSIQLKKDILNKINGRRDNVKKETKKEFLQPPVISSDDIVNNTLDTTSSKKMEDGITNMDSIIFISSSFERHISILNSCSDFVMSYPLQIHRNITVNEIYVYYLFFYMNDKSVKLLISESVAAKLGFYSCSNCSEMVDTITVWKKIGIPTKAVLFNLKNGQYEWLNGINLKKKKTSDSVVENMGFINNWGIQINISEVYKNNNNNVIVYVNGKGDTETKKIYSVDLVDESNTDYLLCSIEELSKTKQLIQFSRYDMLGNKKENEYLNMVTTKPIGTLFVDKEIILIKYGVPTSLSDVGVTMKELGNGRSYRLQNDLVYTVDYYATDEYSYVVKGTYINTPSGYKKIENMVEGEKVKLYDGREVDIILLEKIEMCKCECHLPCLIPKHYMGLHKPFENLLIAPYHAMMNSTHSSFIHPLSLMSLGLPRVPLGQFEDIKIIFYKLKTPNYKTDFIMLNGVVCETWDGYEIGSSKKFGKNTNVLTHNMNWGRKKRINITK